MISTGRPTPGMTYASVCEPPAHGCAAMPSLTAKVIHGKTYYYLRECQRVNGRPKIVRTVYLGTPQKILAAVERAPSTPQQHEAVEIADFGDVAALYDLAEQIGLVEIIDRHTPKTILFTDNDDWTNEEIVLAYRSQHHIEDAFRQMKHPHFLGWMPMFHWTDSKIRVHAFYCVLALMLSSLLARTLHQKGIALSMPRMFELLGGIRETLVIYPRQAGQHKHPTRTSLSQLSAEQEKVLDVLHLRRYLPQ